ncbi:MAG: CvpA family protein [Bacillota bacterium]
MNYLDYIIAGLIIIGFILGYKDGLVRKIIGLLGIFLGIFLGIRLSSTVGKLIAPLMDHEDYLAEIVAGILIFILVIIATSVLKRLIHPHDKVSKFVNQILGGMTGIVQIIFFISGFFLFLNIFNVPDKKTADKSLLYNPVSSIMPKTIDFMIGGKDIFKEYIENKDKNKNELKAKTEQEGKKPKNIDSSKGEKVKPEQVKNTKNAGSDTKKTKNVNKEAKLKTKKPQRNV